MALIKRQLIYKNIRFSLRITFRKTLLLCDAQKKPLVIRMLLFSSLYPFIVLLSSFGERKRVVSREYTKLVDFQQKQCFGNYQISKKLTSNNYLTSKTHSINSWAYLDFCLKLCVPWRKIVCKNSISWHRFHLWYHSLVFRSLFEQLRIWIKFFERLWIN